MRCLSYMAPASDDLPKSRKRPDGILPNFAGFISSSRGNVDLGMTQMVALSRLDPCLHLLSLILRVHCQPTCDLYLGVRQVAHSRIDPRLQLRIGLSRFMPSARPGGFA